jgi:hypothetical protein
MATNNINVASPPSAQLGGTWDNSLDTDMDTLSPLREPQTPPRRRSERSDDEFATPSRPAPTAANKRARFERMKATPTVSVPFPLDRETQSINKETTLLSLPGAHPTPKETTLLSLPGTQNPPVGTQTSPQGTQIQQPSGISDRLTRLEEVLSAERKRLEMAAKVYEHFTCGLDQTLATYNPKDSPEEHKLASQIAQMLSNTLLSHFAGNASTPSPPTTRATTPASGRTWASIASKAPTTATTTTPATTSQSGQGRNRTRAKKPKDLRLFARLPPDSPMRTHTTFALVNALRRHIGADGPKALKDVHKIPSGLALVPRDAQGHQILLAHSKDITTLLSATALDLAQEWTTYVVQDVPDNIPSFLDGEAQAVTEDQVTEEIALFTQAKPTAVRISEAPRKTLGYKNMIVSFLAEEDPQWRGRIYLFGTACLVRKFERKPMIVQCERCHGFHSTRTCVRSQRCAVCASTSHTTAEHPQKSCLSADPHTCPPRCANCLGPHPATAPECLLRPTRKNGAIFRPGREQAKMIRLEEGRRMAKAALLCQRPRDAATQQTSTAEASCPRATSTQQRL